MEIIAIAINLLAGVALGLIIAYFALRSPKEEDKPREGVVHPPPRHYTPLPRYNPYWSEYVKLVWKCEDLHNKTGVYLQPYKMPEYEGATDGKIYGIRFADTVVGPLSFTGAYFFMTGVEKGPVLLQETLSQRTK